MYIPHHFKATRPEEVRAFIDAHPFGVLVSQGSGRVQAVHIPMELQATAHDELILTTHISRANPISQDLADGHEVLCIFQGPHAFVSASWYAAEVTTVSTWNYQAVHVYGTVELIHDTQAVYTHLQELMQRYETSVQSDLQLSDIPDGKVQQLMRGIVAFHIQVTDVQAAWKLSQNRDDISHQQVMDHLSGQPDPLSAEVAQAMQRQRYGTEEQPD